MIHLQDLYELFNVKRTLTLFWLLQNRQDKKINSRQKQSTYRKQSELAAKHSKLNELTPRQTEKITAAKQTLQIDGAGYVSHFKAVFVY